jgi:thymidylate kinase
MGKFIVITGLDGSGTNTIAEALHSSDTGSSLMTSPPFPFATNRHVIDEKVYDKSPVAHYLYYLAANVYQTEVVNERLANSDANIYCVRHFIDTVVSHRAKGVAAKYEYETELYSIRKPDAIFYLDCEESERKYRVNERGSGFLDEQLNDDILRENFLHEFAALEEDFVRISTTNRDVEDIVKEIRDYL